MHFNRLLAQQEARHVEIVDHHVAEQSAGSRDVARRWRRWIARQNGYEFDRTDLAGADAGLEGGKTRIETPVEADHQPAVRAAHDVEAGANARGAEINGLFAKHRLAGPHRALDQVRVSVGRRANDNRVDVTRLDDRIDGAD